MENKMMVSNGRGGWQAPTWWDEAKRGPWRPYGTAKHPVRSAVAVQDPAPDPDAAELVRLRAEREQPCRYLTVEPLGYGVPQAVRRAADATARACAADLGL